LPAYGDLSGFEGESELLHELYRRGLAQPEIAPSLYAGEARAAMRGRVGAGCLTS